MYSHSSGLEWMQEGLMYLHVKLKEEKPPGTVGAWAAPWKLLLLPGMGHCVGLGCSLLPCPTDLCQARVPCAASTCSLA